MSLHVDKAAFVGRPITIAGFPADADRRSPDQCGPAPQQTWIDIDRLVIDPSYQREIGRQGRGNIARIAANFAWKYFSPVIVAPVPGGLYAVVDGQHRSTAALLVGHPAVPCHVIFADRAEQAQAFSAINGAITRVHSLAMHHAAVSAGEPGAVEIQRIASAAGVTVLRYPVPELKQLPAQTMAVGALRDCLREYGADALGLGLRAVVETPNRIRGGLTATIVRGVSSIAAIWLARGMEPAGFIARIGDTVLIREADKAASGPRPKGVSTATALTGRLRERFGLGGG